MTRFAFVLSLVLLTINGQAFCQAADPAALLQRKTLPDDATIVGNLRQLIRSAGRDGGEVEGPWQAVAGGDRGIEDVYDKVAPAVVLVRTGFGHGTGFLVRGDWLLTNHHVVDDADYSSKAGGQVVDVHLGVLGDNGWMKLLDKSHRGLVFRTSRRRDLALVKILDMADEDRDDALTIKLAPQTPRPLTECVAIGHPARGTLWTSRTGELVGAGTFPDDTVDTVMQLLGVSARERPTVEKTLRQDPERRQVILSSCGLNPGDSGGPLVDEAGRLIAVSFAVPSLAGGGQVGVGNFSYHVHLEEVKKFLADWPSDPVIDAPDPLPWGAYKALLDRDQDGFFDTMAIGLRPNDQMTGMALDLDGDSFGGRSTKELARLQVEFSLDDWDYEFVIAAFPRSRYSFDTDNDGTIDLVFSDEDRDGQLDTEIRLQGGKWTVSAESSPSIGPELFRDDRLKKQFEHLLSVGEEEKE